MFKNDQCPRKCFICKVNRQCVGRAGHIQWHQCTKHRWNSSDKDSTVSMRSELGKALTRPPVPQTKRLTLQVPNSLIFRIQSVALTAGCPFEDFILEVIEKAVKKKEKGAS